MKHEYPFQVFWSEEDKAYLATALQLHGCIADGPTVEEAIQNLRVVVGEWIETAEADGRDIPEPWTVVEYSQQYQADQAELQRQIESAISKAVRQMMEHMSSQRVISGRFLQPAGFELEHSGRRR